MNLGAKIPRMLKMGFLLGLGAEITHPKSAWKSFMKIASSLEIYFFVALCVSIRPSSNSEA